MNGRIFSTLALIFILSLATGNSLAAGQNDHAGHGGAKAGQHAGSNANSGRQGGRSATAMNNAAESRVYTVRGVIESIEISQSKILIKHGAVPELQWPAMSMNFGVESPDLLRGLKPGLAVRFDFHRKGEDYIIVDIEEGR
ncbi:MAG: copper-binding protein [Desulfovibrio sp.]|jgi:Cu/Ag efflux protein CusF|nr:copper-binding protein [Desulfovibrio sp.]